jgi:hypothetical protein
MAHGRSKMLVVWYKNSHICFPTILGLENRSLPTSGPGQGTFKANFNFFYQRGSFSSLQYDTYGAHFASAPEAMGSGEPI